MFSSSDFHNEFIIHSFVKCWSNVWIFGFILHTTTKIRCRFSPYNQSPFKTKKVKKSIIVFDKWHDKILIEFEN